MNILASSYLANLAVSRAIVFWRSEIMAMRAERPGAWAPVPATSHTLLERGSLPQLVRHPSKETQKEREHDNNKKNYKK